jgi:hypothetical protein
LSEVNAEGGDEKILDAAKQLNFLTKSPFSDTSQFVDRSLTAG